MPKKQQLNERLYKIHLECEKKSPLNLCTEQSPKESDDTRCCTNTIWPPEDEHNSARNMYTDVISVLE